MLARLYVVWDLLEDNVFSCQPLRVEGRQLAVDHFWSFIRRQAGKDFPGEDVTTVFRLIAKDAVIQEVIRNAVMHAEQRRGFLSFGLKWRVGFGKPYVRRQRSESNCGIDLAFLVEDCFAQFVEVKTASTLPIDILADATLFAIDYLSQARYSMSNGVFTHLNPNISPSYFVGNGSSCPRAKERVKNNIIWVS